MTDRAADSTLTFDAAELASLEPLGTRRAVEAGDYLYRAGDSGYDFYVVLSGRVEILLDADGEERVIATHGPGRFLGELNLLTGLRVFVSARVAESGRGPRRAGGHPPPDHCDPAPAERQDPRHLHGAAGRPHHRRRGGDAGDRLALLARDPPDPRVPGQDPAALPVARPRHRSAGGVSARAVPDRADRPARRHFLRRDPAPDQPGRARRVPRAHRRQPARNAAWTWSSSAEDPPVSPPPSTVPPKGLRTIGVDMVAPGGQAGTSSRIENYFGFPTGISGSDLTQRGLVQAEKFGASLTAPCTAVALREQAGHLVIELSDGTNLAARAVIAASGARYRRLDVDRLSEFESRGVYYAATDLEARQCSGDPVVVVGGGNSAGQAAVFLAEQGSQVTVVIRGPDLNAGMSRYLVDRLESHPHIEVLTQTQVVGLEGEQSLRAARLAGPGRRASVDVAGLFSFIGAEPIVRVALRTVPPSTTAGFVLTDRSLSESQLDGRWNDLGRRPFAFETSQPGLFAVGDLRSGSTKRVAAAVGEGSAAVTVGPRLSAVRGPVAQSLHGWC